MTITVRNLSGAAVQLSETPFAQGGEAAVHTVPQHLNVVVKLYHPQVLEKRADALRAKVEVMSTDAQFAHLKKHPSLAWPQFSVIDDHGKWRGYAMRKAGGVRMNVLAHAMAYREHFQNLDRPAVVSYLLNLLGTLRELNAAGVMLGDYNLANFLCDPSSDAVTLIDCDSWQINSGGKTFFCPVAAPDMLAPELQGKELGKTSRELESEAFSLAILIFKTLMLGRHPYDVVGGDGPVENIRNGYFPYGPGGGGIPKGPWFNIWSHLPYKLKEQLIYTFKEGASNPFVRTTTMGWIETLALYKRELDRGWFSTQVKPTTPKTKEYRGARSISQPIVG